MASKKPTKASTNKTTKSSSKVLKSAAETSSARRAPTRSRTLATAKKPMAGTKSKSGTPVAASPGQSVVKKQDDTVELSGGQISKRELIDRVMEDGGLKKGEARRAVNAMLNVLVDAFRDGKDIAAAPLGKVKMVRKKKTPNGDLVVLRAKLRDPAADGEANPDVGPAE